jgi:transcription elongation factor GreB
LSKAFTNEETPDPAPVIRPPPRLAPGEVRYVTPEGRAGLLRDLESLRARRDPRAAVVEATLAALTVLGPEQAPEGRAGFGCWVTVREATGTPLTWRIVGPDEADPGRGRVSAHSPVGRALIGAAPGDLVEVERPGGRQELEVVAVHRSAP